MKAIFRIFANNPPSIAIAIAGLLSLVGKYSEAAVFLIVGLLLQAFWLIGQHLL